MLVEIWSNLISLLRTIAPMLSPAPKLKLKKIIDWCESQPSKHHGINQSEINDVIKYLDQLKRFLSPTWAKKISDGQYFLKSLNNGPNAEWLEHKGTCVWWNYFWYDGSCHAEKKEEPFDCRTFRDKRTCQANGCFWWANSCHPEPQPPPPPPPVPCSAHTTQNSCIAGGCYWWNGSCHPDTEPPPPPPPPPPIILECKDHTKETICLSNGCYWYNGACHDQPELPPPGEANPLREFAKQVQAHCGTIPLSRPLEIVNCGILHAILVITADVFDSLKGK